MLLEMGLDKMRKDYINYLIGNTHTHTHCSVIQRSVGSNPEYLIGCGCSVKSETVYYSP